MWDPGIDLEEENPLRAAQTEQSTDNGGCFCVCAQEHVGQRKECQSTRAAKGMHVSLFLVDS